MAQQPPIKTTPEDIDALTKYLRNQVGWTSITDTKKAIQASYADSRKLDAMKYIGLIERDQENIKLSEAGRKYVDAGSKEQKAKVVAPLLKNAKLYDVTLQWFHYEPTRSEATKTDVANYWLEKHNDLLGGAQGDALTDAAVFFLRVADLTGLGKFIAAGKGRETHIKLNRESLEVYVTGTQAPAGVGAGAGAAGAEQQTPPPPPPAVNPALQINIEIHIAANAEPSTIEEIFKNMRKYVLGQPDETAGS